MLNTGWVQQTSGACLPTTLLHHFFEAQVALRPDKCAVEFCDESWSYAELDRYANRIAHSLIARGVRPGDLVAIFLKKSLELYGTMLGIMKAGAGYVPIDPRYPLERIRAILEDLRARAIVTSMPLSVTIEGAVDIPLLHLDRQGNTPFVPASTVPILERAIEPTDLCYVIYTSGSSGRPKGVMIEHRNAAAFVRSLNSIYNVTARDRVYQGFSTAFDASVEEIWAAFSLGGTLVVPTEEVERSPVDAAEFIHEQDVSYFSTVPTMLTMIDHELPKVRTLVLGGEACSAELVSRWARPGRRLLNTYGPTEATVVATWSECHANEAVKIGVPLPGYTAHVLDEDMQPVKPGQSGELFIGGGGVARGYMNLPELTRERFFADPFGTEDGDRLYRTYDHVRLGDNGELYFLGRLDSQIKIRGFRVELSEIEAVLIEHPTIKAAAATVVCTQELQELAAYVVCEGGGQTIDRTALAELLRKRVPAYMVPRYLDVLPTLPMMSSGKIDRKALPAPQKPLVDVEVVVPANDLERRIAEAWRDVFRLPDISVEADFFLDLGGHSLLAARAVARMRATTGAALLSIRDIYTHRTIRSLAAHIGRTEPAKGNAIATLAPETDDATDEPLPSEVAFGSVHPLVRWTTATLQAVIAMVYYGILAAPLAYTTLMISAVADGRMDWAVAAKVSTVVGFTAWPLMLLFSIAVKWIVIGRYKPGRYPLWSSYYLRWWIANRFQALAWAEMFQGTPLMSLYWRAMGAKIGRDVTLSTHLGSAFDVVSIGDGTSVGVETQILGYRVEEGCLVIAPVSIGNNCFIGMQCALGLGSRMGNGARLDDMSLLPDGTEMATGEARRGIPAMPAMVSVPTLKRSPARGSRGKRFAHSAKRTLYGLAHLALIYVMGYFLILTTVPGLALVLGALYLGGPALGVAAAFLAVPLWLFSYIRGAIMLKHLIGPLKAGTFSLYSVGYVRHWFSAYLLENTKTILAPVYATVYLPDLMRQFGAKIGRGVEISTVSHICPDLVEIGDRSFLADACLVGGRRIHNGLLEIGTVRIGSRSFIGNSAVVTGGHMIGDNVLIGVASTPPADTLVVPTGTRWIGSPSFELPSTQKDVCFADTQIFRPTVLARLERALTEAVRVVLPGLVTVTCALPLVAYLLVGTRAFPLANVLAATPLVAMGLAFVAVLVCATVKTLLTGQHGEVVRPLWSRFVWHNELINGLYETVAAAAMQPLMGTPLIAPCLRMMGCRIGKWCFIDTTLFSEFDLVDIGDKACLNIGATIQTHLFEDRIFKAGHVRIGQGCSVGNMAVVLYGTEMQPGSALGPLSVLMKGEILPQRTHWHGIPCERIVGNSSTEQPPHLPDEQTELPLAA